MENVAVFPVPGIRIQFIDRGSMENIRQRARSLFIVEKTRLLRVTFSIIQLRLTRLRLCNNVLTFHTGKDSPLLNRRRPFEPVGVYASQEFFPE